MAGYLSCPTILLVLALAACAEPLQGTVGRDHPIFAVTCTQATAAQSPAVIMVSARAITVAPHPPGAVLSWAGQDSASEPERIDVAPGQQCTIYRAF